MAGEEKMFWIISYSGSDADDVISYVAYGTEKDAESILLGYCLADAESDFYDDGSAEACWKNGHLYAYSMFSDRHYDYTATPLKTVLDFEKGVEVPVKIGFV